ncbi:hypothetical protein ACIBG0_25085 [Nocardia sp. NPDC050630]|uniref:hypothetical protein n=1 Tax=Nocardia sp. NPDC050630 TaxID=3364321 RepID=UPI0037B2FC3B
MTRTNRCGSRGVKVRALLARLAMEPGRIVPADAIWDGHPPDNGANALQALVRTEQGSTRRRTRH